jgi:hypothetical protein
MVIFDCAPDLVVQMDRAEITASSMLRRRDPPRPSDAGGSLAANGMATPKPSAGEVLVRISCGRGQSL